MGPVRRPQPAEDLPPAPGPRADDDNRRSPVSQALLDLRAAEVEFLVLRGLGATATPQGDVDVLVNADDMGLVRSLLVTAGWLQVPGPGHGSHRFFATYDGETWSELDLVSAVEFGPLLEYPTNLAPSCLARRVVRDEVPALQPDDEFWWTFVHLAWKPYDQRRLDELAALAAPATTEGPVAALVARLTGWDEAELRGVLADAQQQDEERLAAAHETLRRRMFAADPVAATRRRAQNWLRRRSVSERPGLSIALIGLDGAGKTTVAVRLHTEVPWPTVPLYLGVWKAAEIDVVLRHVPGARLILRLGRLARTTVRARYHVALGRVVVLDRFLVDAGLPTPALDWRGRVSRALVTALAWEPDRVVFLDAPAEVVFARKGELTVEELRGRREYYRSLAERSERWITVDAERPLADVLAEVFAVVWADLRAGVDNAEGARARRPARAAGGRRAGRRRPSSSSTTESDGVGPE